MMWMQVADGNLPGEIADVTSSIWQYNELARVGVMKSSMISPPHLWIEIFQSSLGALKLAQSLLNELQGLIYKPLVYAETDIARPRDAKFLTFLGFTHIDTQGSRHLFARSHKLW